ncbi:MAG: hypothetical protein ACI8S6_001548 [Myxococcota bacterium]|jgi:hypothetical protein
MTSAISQAMLATNLMMLERPVHIPSMYGCTLVIRAWYW